MHDSSRCGQSRSSFLADSAPPHRPPLNPALGLFQDSSFERINERLRAAGTSDTVPLHQGKTYFQPCAAPGPWGRESFEFLAHEHAPPGGTHQLRDALARTVTDRTGRPVDPRDVVVTNGATHGIFVALQSVLDHDSEVLLPSPQWLFASGVIKATGGIPVEVPMFVDLVNGTGGGGSAGLDIVAALERAITPRTRALYCNNPNNPTGYRLSSGALLALINLAARHDLWIVADNAYESYDFSEEGFVDIAALPGGVERTMSVYTFSKSYAMPGHRIGFVVSPPGLGPRLVNAALYSVYSVATASQFAALEALETPVDELRKRRRLALEAWRLVDRTLHVPHTRAGGGLYTFLDLSAVAVGTEHFLERCLEAGVALAPGLSFGRHCSRFARLCYTAVPPERLAVGLERINRVWRSLT